MGEPDLAAKMLGHAGFQAQAYSELNAVDKPLLQLLTNNPV
ncbi:hypothetical protein [Pseudomonas grimontii]